MKEQESHLQIIQSEERRVPHNHPQDARTRELRRAPRPTQSRGGAVAGGLASQVASRQMVGYS